MSSANDEQQFCLRWNNFQANITSQFETLRDDEDFTDVTIACEGQRLQAHKVVLSACSPFFKELFKTNPCQHPIIFMRDVEARHIVALMEFMYAGEVNVAQAQLSAFLKTAESLRIRGLTDTSSSSTTTTPTYKEKEDDTLFFNPKQSCSKTNATKRTSHRPQISSTSTVTSSQDVRAVKPNSPPPKRSRSDTTDTDISRLHELDIPFTIQEDRNNGIEPKSPVLPKVELPDYTSDEDKDENADFFHYNNAEITGGMEIIPQASNPLKDVSLERSESIKLNRMRTVSDSLSPNSFYTDTNTDGQSRLVKLGEGIEICEEQLRSVKWSDYRKLTRGLATILFSPAELATCSVTGQRWSRAGNDERPVKPALDRAKVQAIISYVATRFPMVEISRIKQVLAYKCKENSTALKMKSVRYYGCDQNREEDK